MQITDKKIMPPLWLAYPEIERYSIGWRMGYGEDYKYKFFDWFETLSQEEKAQYRTLFPEPVTWKGWWENTDACEWLEHDEFWIFQWRESGTPKYTKAWFQREAAGGKRFDLCMFWKPPLSEDEDISQSCLSQWSMQEFRYVVEEYSCMEQFMMEQKAKLFGDEEIRKCILESQDPRQMKALGQKVRGFDETLWDTFKHSIVLNGNWCKFSQNRKLRDFLLSTGDSILVEASPYDKIWGIGLSADSPDAQNPFKWRGRNMLGFALMEVRDELRRITQNEALCEWRGFNV